MNTPRTPTLLRLLGCALLLGPLPALLLGGCRPPDATSVAGANAGRDAGTGAGDEIQADWKFSPQPPRMGPSQWTVALKDRSGKPVTGARVALEGNMSHPGMEPVPAQLKEVAPGQYKGTLNFTMGGDWFVQVDAALKDGRAFRQQWSVPGVRS